jgi:hypothetical protein
VLDSSHNLISGSIAAVGLVNAAAYNYNLTDSSPAINAGTNAGWVYDIAPVTPFSLTPVYQYVDSANSEPRVISGSAIDIGAYEYPLPNSMSRVSAQNLSVRILQQSSFNEIVIELKDGIMNEDAGVNIYDATGRLLSHHTLGSNSSLLLNTFELAPGVYIAKVETATGVCAEKFIIAR